MNSLFVCFFNKYCSSVNSTAGYPRVHELERRQSHTEKERVRRGEMRQSFAALKKALNIEERLSVCRHDILNQASIMPLRCNCSIDNKVKGGLN